MSATTPQLADRAHEERIAALRRLTACLAAIEHIGSDRFVAPPAHGAFDRLYGGQSLAEAFRAAAATVPDGRAMHSAQCHFLRLGDPRHTTDYTVGRLHDTRSFSVRQVLAEQAGRAILTATFSFAAASDGIAHQAMMPQAPPPEAVRSRDVVLYALHGPDLPSNVGVPWPLDLRHVDRHPWEAGQGDGHHRIWMRADESLPDDPLLHSSLLLYASDLTMADAVTVQHAEIAWDNLVRARGMFGASLSHVLWQHAPVRMDEWLLHVQESPRAASGRGFTTGRFYDRAGTLVASVAQEIFIRQTDRA